MNALVFIILFNILTQTNASEFSKFINKISQATTKVKTELLEFFYRFRTFFMGHSRSTHSDMTTKGCGYAVDDEPTIYNKQGNIVAKIRGGDSAIWHTW